MDLGELFLPQDKILTGTSQSLMLPGL